MIAEAFTRYRSRNIQVAQVLKPAYQEKNFVLRGQFTPIAYHPSWFANYGILKSEEATKASVEVVSEQLTQFKTEWLRFRAIGNGLLLATVEPEFFEPLRDLVVGMLEIVADSSPVWLLGMNHDFHFRSASSESWHSIGHELAPKDKWSPLSSRLGLKSLVIEGQREDDLEGFILATVEPSQRFDPNRDEYGVHINVNDHIELSAKEEALAPSSATRAVEVINQNWVESGKRAMSVADSLMSIAG